MVRVKRRRCILVDQLVRSTYTRSFIAMMVVFGWCLDGVGSGAGTIPIRIIRNNRIRKQNICVVFFVVVVCLFVIGALAS